MGIEAIDTDQGEVAARLARLFHELTHPRLRAHFVVVRKLGHTELTGILNWGEQDAAVIGTVGGGEGMHDGIEGFTDQVVAKEHDKPISADELTCRKDGM